MVPGCVYFKIQLKQMMRAILFFLFLANVAFGQSYEWRLEIPSAWVLSSPRMTDLNQDGARDVVIGGGGEDTPMPDGVLAVDGVSGKVLWRLPVRDQVYGSALFYDLNQDGVEDVFICGRGALMLAIDGKRGVPIWEFWPDSMGKARDFGWYNFYQPQFIGDINSDGVPDLLTANGGDNKAGASGRPTGNLLILSGTDGSLLKIGAMPDGRETYFAPMFYQENSIKRIVFGSGGESLGGSIWEVNFEDFLQTGTQHARTLLTDSARGFIAHPAWADLTEDGLAELIVPQHNGKLWALNLLTDQVLWELDFPGYQLYAAPCVGRFVGDPTPDVYLTLAEGVFSFYKNYVPIVVDGKTGQVAWSDSSEYSYQLSQPNVLDWDQDGVDEVLRLHNQDAIDVGRLYYNEFEIVDFNDSAIVVLGEDRPGTSVFSTPFVTNLDGDNKLDVVFAYTPSIDKWSGNYGSRLERIELPLTVAEADIAWNGYLGNLGKGIYEEGLLSSLSPPEVPSLWVYPNPFQNRFYVKGYTEGEGFRLRDLSGRVLMQGRARAEVETVALPAGVYVLEVGKRRRMVVKE